MDGFVLEGERLDDIGFGNLKLIQKPEEFCYGIDAVILADFAAKMMNSGRKKCGTAADLGSGTGIVPIILQHKAAVDKIYAVEVQSDSFERIKRNITINGLERRIEAVHADVLNLTERFSELKNTCDVVMSNPPYMTGGCGIMNGNKAKTIARHETTAGLKDFIKTASELLKDRGELFMVHRPSRLVDICDFCRQFKLEPKNLQFVSPDRNSKPNILLIRAVKYGRPELFLEDPLYVYEENGGNYTQEIMNIYERF